MSNEFEFKYSLRHESIEQNKPLTEHRRAYVEKLLAEYQEVNKGHRDALKLKSPFYWDEIMVRIR